MLCAKITRNRFAVFCESLRFDQVHVIGGVVWQSKCGAMFEAFDEQAESIQRSESFWTEDFGQSAGACPVEGRGE